MGKQQRMKEARKLARQLPHHQGFLSNTDPEERLAPDRASWPVVKAYVPLRDAWQATGYGTAGVIRVGPNGKSAAAFFVLNLAQQGLHSMFGRDMDSLTAATKVLTGMQGLVPPYEEGPVELAAEYVYGAWAFAEKSGASWPPRQTARFLALMPRPEGGSAQWLARLTGTGGLTPPGLLRALLENPEPEGIPDSQERMLPTTMTFTLEQDAGERLRSASPAFRFQKMDGETELYSFTREYPKGHWSGRKGRQEIGRVLVRPGELVARAFMLSMAARLVAELKELLGERIQLVHTDWKNADQFLATAESSAPYGFHESGL